jgi:hypothetical protein
MLEQTSAVKDPAVTIHLTPKAQVSNRWEDRKEETHVRRRHRRRLSGTSLAIAQTDAIVPTAWKEKAISPSLNTIATVATGERESTPVMFDDVTTAGTQQERINSL